MVQPRKSVFIAVPTADGKILSDTVLSIFNMMVAENTPAMLGSTIEISANAMVHTARNKMIEDFVADPHMTHILFFDSDMTLPSNGLQMLLEDDKDIVGGLCFTRRLPVEPTVYESIIKEDKELYRNLYSYPRDSVFETDATGGACLLVKKDVFLKMEHPWFEFKHHFGEDIYFCRKAKELGYKIWVDSRVKVGHIGEIEFNENMFDTIMAMSGEKTKEAARWGLDEPKPKTEEDPFKKINEMPKK